DTVRLRRTDDAVLHSVSNLVTPGHELNTRGSANRLDVILLESYSSCCEFIHKRRKNFRLMVSNIMVSHVIRKNKQKMRLFTKRRSFCRTTARPNKLRFDIFPLFSQSLLLLVLVELRNKVECYMLSLVLNDFEELSLYFHALVNFNLCSTLVLLAHGILFLLKNIF
ncbi:unnamed protein product, partial [Oikopleura dioica]